MVAFSFLFVTTCTVVRSQSKRSTIPLRFVADMCTWRVANRDRVVVDGWIACIGFTLARFADTVLVIEDAVVCSVSTESRLGSHEEDSELKHPPSGLREHLVWYC